MLRKVHFRDFILNVWKEIEVCAIMLLSIGKRGRIKEWFDDLL